MSLVESRTMLASYLSPRQAWQGQERRKCEKSSYETVLNTQSTQEGFPTITIHSRVESNCLSERPPIPFS